MKILQEKSFKPITLTLETAEEANAFWGILEVGAKELRGEDKELALKLSNWFSNNAEL
jgi:hypothetical protein